MDLLKSIELDEQSRSQDDIYNKALGKAVGECAAKWDSEFESLYAQKGSLGKVKNQAKGDKEGLKYASKMIDLQADKAGKLSRQRGVKREADEDNLGD